MNLSERFYNHLLDQNKTEFTTREALLWYDYQKLPGTKPARHTDLNFLILNPLILQKLIKRIFPGQYLVLGLENTYTLNPDGSYTMDTPNLAVDTTTKNLEDSYATNLSGADQEFFDYLEKKTKVSLKLQSQHKEVSKTSLEVLKEGQ